MRLDKPMNCLLYLRVSTEDQVKNFSLDTQQELCTEYAKRKGYAVLKTFREEGESAKSADRPQLIALLDYCRKHKKDIGVVLVYKFDRLARQTSDHLAVKAKLAEYAIRLESVTEPTDDSPAGKFMETLFAAVAQLDNEVRAERIKNGMYSRFKAGLIRVPPLGYMTAEVNGRRVPVEDPQTFLSVKRAWDLMATGTRSLSEMVEEMNRMGLRVKYHRKKKLITKQYLSKSFSNKFYMGVLESKVYNEEVKGMHTPMVSEETFYRVQALLSKNNRLPMTAKRRRYNPLFPLRGILRCSECNRPLVSANVKGRSKLYPKYWCSGNCIPSGDADKIHILLKEELALIQPNEDMVNAFTLCLRAKYEQRKTKLMERKNTAEKKILEQKEMMCLLVEGHLKGFYSDEIYKQEKVKIEDKILTLQIVANDELCGRYDIERTVNFIRALFQDLAKAYDVSDYGQKQILLGSIYPFGVMFDGKRLLNRKIGTGFRAIQTFSEGEKTSCEPERT